MINVCANCGLYHPDKVIDLAGPYAICPACGHKHPFRQLPLLMVAGASGAGKTVVCQYLAGRLDEVVVLEADILWRAEFAKPEDGYRDFIETWLRLCKNISQSGRPVVLFCAGGIPGNIESCVERRYFSRVHYLALIADDRDLAERLRQRPAWRQSSGPAFVQQQLRFNRWFKDVDSTADPAIALLDTTGVPVQATVEQVAAWIGEQLNEETSKQL